MWLQKEKSKQGHAQSGLGKRRPYGLLVTAPAQVPGATGNSLGALARGFGALRENRAQQMFMRTEVKTMISLRGFGKDKQDEGRTESSHH